MLLNLGREDRLDVKGLRRLMGAIGAAGLFMCSLTRSRRYIELALARKHHREPTGNEPPGRGSREKGEASQ